MVAQDSLNMTRVGQWSQPNMPTTSGVTYNDIWGYTTPTGEEYAIVGNVDSILIVDITDCTNPQRVYGYAGGNTAIWRDFKTYDTYVYSVCDGCNEGMHIFDMSALPAGNVTHELTTTNFFDSCHNIYIDTSRQKLYATGTNTAEEGVVILDLSTTPADPSLIAEIEFDDELNWPSANFYVHDIYVRNDTAYASHGYQGYYVWDLSNLNNISVLGDYDGGAYNHSSWTTPDAAYAYYAEEVPTGRPMAVVDLANLGHPINDITVVHTFEDALGNVQNSTPHNPFIKDDTLYISYYEDGLKVYDLSNPALPALVGYYDTYPDNGSTYNGYDGAWGTYPFFDSGCICVSDTKYGLSVIKNCTEVTYYLDSDGDGFGDANESISTCDTPPANYILDKFDCDDTDPSVNPNAIEICDEIDNDCDGLVDEELGTDYFEDADMDGYGNASVFVTACTRPPGYVADNTDCDDTDASISPGATELCDDIDNNCDGQVDENLDITYFEDADADGYGNPNVTIIACTTPMGYVVDNTDCDDTDGAVNPGAAETCDGVDNNCDGQVDEGCTLDLCDYLNLSIATIAQDTYRIKYLLDSDAIIASNTGVVYRAGQAIDLLPSFEVTSGTEFLAEIVDCDETNLLTTIGPSMPIELISALSSELLKKHQLYLLIQPRRKKTITPYSSKSELLKALSNLDPKVPVTIQVHN